MSKPDNQFEVDARKMAERIEKHRAVAEQLTLLPDEVPEVVADQDGGQVGRPKGAKNKATSQLRDWLAAQGMRMPEDVLTEIAGLRTREDAITLAMARAERILAWSFDGAHIGKKAAPAATSHMRMTVFGQQYAIILRALEAIMPYTGAKATPDVNVTQNTTFIVPSAPQAAPDPAAGARDVTPPRKGRMMPANVARKSEQNQSDSQSAVSGSDKEIRTE